VYTRSPFALWTAGFTPPALPSAASQPQLRASSQSAGGRKRLCEGGEQLEGDTCAAHHSRGAVRGVESRSMQEGV